MNIVCLDNGHGSNTPGKCSPDGQFREYQWTRKLAYALKAALQARGIRVINVCPETTDTLIRTRVARVNALCRNKDNVICVSLHNNAAGADGKWHNAQGWSAFVAPNASSNSKLLAGCFVDAAKDLKIKVRQPLPTQKYWVQNLGMCRDTKCPAVLTESLFQDNKEDVEYLISEEGFNAMLKIHLNGILKYFGRTKSVK